MAYVDTNRPNFAQLTNIQEWLNSLNLNHYLDMFILKSYLNLSQILHYVTHYCNFNIFFGGGTDK